ncbi:MAG: M20/M25/M40 family metallo-hydrolase, partial [Candidatus Zixiibacteriota bacterium]
MIDAIDIDAGYLLDTLKKMISIDSVLPREERLAAFIADEIRSFGIEPEWREVAPGRPNVCALTDLGPADHFLVFSGHSDTVGAAAGWQTDPFSPVIRNGRLYGLGAANMKGGLACCLAAFRALVQTSRLRGGPGRLGIAVTVDQEGHSIGARALLKTEYGRCNAMLHAEHFYGDSERNYLPMACTGKVLYRLTVRGRAAHAFRPHSGGINAIADASRIIGALDKLNLKEHPLFGKETACVLKIEGGFKEYSIVVPERCEIVITRLIVPGETADTAFGDMEQLIDSLNLQSTVAIETPPPCYSPYILDQ